ncbi:DUF1343 domain-containing protein, partial [Singulisphaera rosea]
LLYPGVGLLEATTLATGRGTDTPFERVGAPWIDPRTFAQALNGLNLDGVRFVPIRFTPKERQFSGKDCGGVQITITDRSRFDPLRLGIGMALALRKTYRETWEPKGLMKLMCDQAAYQAILDGKSLDEIEAQWKPELDAFRAVRSRYLLYKD